MVRLKKKPKIVEVEIKRKRDQLIMRTVPRFPLRMAGTLLAFGVVIGGAVTLILMQLGVPIEVPPSVPISVLWMSGTDPEWLIEVIGNENFQIRNDPGGVKFFISGDNMVTITGTSGDTTDAQAALYVNDTDTTADEKIIAAAADGSARFNVDTDGDMWNSDNYYLGGYIYPGTGTGTQSENYIYSSMGAIRFNSGIYVDENIRTPGFVKSANNVFCFLMNKQEPGATGEYQFTNTSAQAYPFSDVPVDGAWVDPDGACQVKIVIRGRSVSGDTVHFNWTDGAGNWGTWIDVSSTSIANYQSSWEDLTWTGLRNFTTQYYVDAGTGGIEGAYLLIKPQNP